MNDYWIQRQPTGGTTVNEWWVCPYVDDSWAVGAYEAGGVLAQKLMFDPNHVLLGDALCDAHHQGHLRIDGLDDGRGSERRGHINHRGVCACCIPRLRQKGGEAGRKERLMDVKRPTARKHCHLMFLEENPHTLMMLFDLFFYFFTPTSLTELKTGRSKWVLPPLPGETPPTSWEP